MRSGVRCRASLPHYRGQLRPSVSIRRSGSAAWAPANTVNIVRQATETPPSVHEWPRFLVCPYCRKPSESIKQFILPIVIFAVAAGGWQTKRVNACPPCMRHQLKRNAIRMLLFANVLWPFLVLPITVGEYRRSRQPGHDQAVLSQILDP